MKSIVIDPRLQTILENLNDAKKRFNEVYLEVKSEGIHIYESTQKDFMSDIDSAISNTTCMVAQKLEYDVKRDLCNIKEEGGRK